MSCNLRLKVWGGCEGAGTFAYIWRPGCRFQMLGQERVVFHETKFNQGTPEI